MEKLNTLNLWNEITHSSTKIQQLLAESDFKSLAFELVRRQLMIEQLVDLDCEGQFEHELKQLADETKKTIQVIHEQMNEIICSLKKNKDIRHYTN